MIGIRLYFGNVSFNEFGDILWKANTSFEKTNSFATMKYLSKGLETYVKTIIWNNTVDSILHSKWKFEKFVPGDRFFLDFSSH